MVETDKHNQTPQHVAIIMDGNGRWAAERNLPRAVGHKRGMDAVRRTVEAAIDLKLTYLTLYSFSTENWKRPVSEVNDLMGLMRKFVETDLSRLDKQGVRVRVIGDRESLSNDLISIVTHSEQTTISNDKLNLTIAFNYGGRDEIIRAAKAIAVRVQSGDIALDEISADMLSGTLDTGGLPDPEIVIRTSGEKRVSNFLLWQTAYSEFFFPDVYWPDFGREHLSAVLDDFAKRDRRFGGASRLEAS